MTAAMSETRIDITGGTAPRPVTRFARHGGIITGGVAVVAGVVFLTGAAAGAGGGFALVLLVVAALVVGAAFTALRLERSFDGANRDERVWMFGALCAPALRHRTDGAGDEQEAVAGSGPGRATGVDETAAGPGVAALESQAA